MKSIKPGRGPSAMGLVGSIIAVLFGLFWTILAFGITRDAPFPLVGIIFPLFGVIFIIAGIANAIYSYKNVTGKERMSIIDIVDEDEEGDPLNRRFGQQNTRTFCPYCGTKTSDHYRFCPSCGSDIKNSSSQS